MNVFTTGHVQHFSGEVDSSTLNIGQCHFVAVMARRKGVAGDGRLWTLPAVAACALLVVSTVTILKRDSDSGTDVQRDGLEQRRDYTWGIPYTLGGKQPFPRVPVRSTDSMGEILPEISNEVQPPGAFKVNGTNACQQYSVPQPHANFMSWCHNKR